MGPLKAPQSHIPEPFHRRSSESTNFVHDRDQMWERACSRWGHRKHHKAIYLNPPTGDLQRAQILCMTEIKCGSELARDGAIESTTKPQPEPFLNNPAIAPAAVKASFTLP